MRAKGSNPVALLRIAIASRISDARSRPNVIKRIESDDAPSLIREMAASIRTVVLPLPATP